MPFKCGERNKLHDIEEKMTEALVRRCHKCNLKFLKESGCNMMRCHCGATQCYVCSKPIAGHDHFNQPGSLYVFKY